MNVQVIAIISTLVSLGLAGYSLHRISRRSKPRALFWVFMLYISTACLFGNVYYEIYAGYIGEVASLLEEPAGKLLESVDIENAIHLARHRLAEPPFLIQGGLSAVEIKPTIGMIDELDVKWGVGTARAEPDDPWRSAKDLNPNVSPNDHLTDQDRALIELTYMPYSEELAKLLEQPDVRWKDVLPALRRQSAVILKRSKANLPKYWQDLGESYQRRNTGLAAYLDFLYFSFVTITTLGYGDILPNTAAVRVLVMLELLAGLGIAVFFVSLVQANRGGRE